MFTNVVLVIGHGQNLGFLFVSTTSTWGIRVTHINVINTDRLQDLSLDSVTDSDLCHDGDGDSLHNSSDHTGVGLILARFHNMVRVERTIRATPPSRLMFAGIRSDCKLWPSERSDKLTKSHDGGSTSLLGDLCLFNVHDIHDNTM